MNPLKNEPVISAVVTLITAACAMLAAFGVHLTPTQTALTAQFVQDALLVALVVRSQVTPKVRLDAQTKQAAAVCRAGLPSVEG